MYRASQSADWNPVYRLEPNLQIGHTCSLSLQIEPTHIGPCGEHSQSAPECITQRPNLQIASPRWGTVITPFFLLKSEK